ncbi:DUF58 domain-containing protein [Aquibacillus sediminis]|uniref:DUF58 domain-containing protein n=1 Tax=Aquibacillus sediminis TaxID=2574734 RepID=UPI00110875B6|nr:DUF58 domain-containing protein [Aquibacillus sediminis]
MLRSIGTVFKLLQLIVLFGLLFSYAMFQGGFVSWFLFYSFLPFMVYMGLFVFYPVSKWDVVRNVTQDTTYVGEQISVEIKIHRRMPFPIFYCLVEDFLPGSLQQKGTNRNSYHHFDQSKERSETRKVKKVFFPWFKRKIHCTYLLTDVPRGEHELHAIRIKTTDLLGFIKKDYVFEVEDSLLVYPAYRDVVRTESMTSKQTGTAPSNTLDQQQTNMVTSIREYVPGDRFSWIDWKATARKGAMMTKEFEQERSSESLVIVDGVAYPGLNKLAFEASVELSHSLIEAYKHQASTLSFLSIGKEAVWFSGQQGAGQTTALKKFLAKVEPSGDVPFPLQLSQQAKRIEQGSTILLVITYLDESMQQAIMQLKQKSKQVIVYIIQPASTISEQQTRLMYQLQVQGVRVNVLTEEQLIQKEFEVNM